MGNVGISIVIPTLNEEHYIGKLLTTITKQTYGGDIDVIVVDGQSSDNTVQIIKSFKHQILNLRLMRSTRGISLQRNTGARAARFELLLFIDADMILPPDFLWKLSSMACRTFEGTTLGRFALSFSTRSRISCLKQDKFVALPFILPHNGSFIDYVYTVISYTGKVILSFIKPVITGKCIITTKANHDRIGGFDDKIVFSEDVEYGLRSHAQGATYHILWRLRLYTSPRRRKEIGLFRMIWLPLYGYWRNLCSKPITNIDKDGYSFGKHQKEL